MKMKLKIFTLNYKGLNDNNYLYDKNQDNIKIEESWNNNI